jgi:hypothetical protein
MTTSNHERALMPAIALQGAIGTLAGFIGFFITAAQTVDAMFLFTAVSQTAATAAIFLSYLFGPRFQIDGARLLKMGFLLPGLLLLFGGDSVLMLGIAFGTFIGLTWGARHWLEMSLLQDAERDAYATHSGTCTVILGVAATLATTLLLAVAGEHGGLVYRIYGMVCVCGAFMLGKRLPRTAPVSLSKPLDVMRQPEFVACLPLFLLESGLYGIGQSLASVGAAHSLGSASHFGWVATVAGLAGGAALYLTRKNRGMNNRMHWLGGSCLVVGLSFVLLGASAWIPALYVAYSVLKAAGGPFLAASEQVLNQRTLDIRGALSDRIFAREVVLWMLRMMSLYAFWALTRALSPAAVLAVGSAVLAAATGMEYLAGKTLFWSRARTVEQAA